MMNIQQKRDLLMSLPLMEQEQRWIMERLDTLSVKEQYQLSAAILRTGKLEELAGKTGWELETAILHMDPEVAVDAVNCLLSLEDYQICFPAGSYAQLGSFYLRHESHLPERAMYYAPACSLETAMWSTRNTPPHLVAPVRDSSRRMTVGV
ncbi:hypothetical protein M5E87_29070 [Flavonifractor plautii]|nr:hypothetical protein M5E87_29070 [Flavonifractor plautii]